MVVPPYAYLALKILGPKGVITVKGSFEVSNTFDKEFNRMVQTFGMAAEYTTLKGETDHNVLPEVGRSLPDQAFDATQDSSSGSPHRPKKDYLHRSKLGSCVGKRARRVTP
jgi:hypothetical protein